MKSRYAIYFIPEPGTALAKLGSALLGRDSETGLEIPQSLLPGFAPERLRSLTAAARNYGLHATLKAPFFLKPGLSEQDLLSAAERFILGRSVTTLPRLELNRIGSFFTLVPARESPEEEQALTVLHSLADDAVSSFDSFRAAPSEQELARRKPHKLGERQREYLFTWGYPYVFDEYRFHFTLTDSITDPAEAQNMEQGLREYFKAGGFSSVRISSICICRQDIYSNADPGEFTLLRRFNIIA